MGGRVGLIRRRVRAGALAVWVIEDSLPHQEGSCVRAAHPAHDVPVQLLLRVRKRERGAMVSEQIAASSLSIE